MSQIKPLHTILLVAFTAQILTCTPEKLSITDTELGSNLDREGNITDKSLQYKFKLKKNIKTYKDFFNFIYFEGDTVCFNISFNKKASCDKIAITYIHNNTPFSAERIDKHPKSLSGFSLLGTLLENSYKDLLDKPFNISTFNNKKIPFSIECILNHKQTTIKKTLNGAIWIILQEPLLVKKP